MSQRQPDATERLAIEIAKDIASNKVATLEGPMSLRLNPDAPIEAFCGLVRTLRQTCDGMDRINTMAKFLMGDALNQSEEIYGESSAQVYGTDIPWSLRTVNNIRWTARSIPSDCRRLNLAFRLFQDLAGLPPDDIRHYVKVAEGYWSDDPIHYRKRVLTLMNEDRCRTLLANIDNKELQDKFTTLYIEHSPHWAVLKGWIDGTELPPMQRIHVDDWVDERLRKLKTDEAANARLKYDVLLREVLTPLLVEMAQGVARGWIETKKKDGEK